jgi:hypothetical protein
MIQLLVTANIVPNSLILSTLMMEVFPPKCQFLQEPHGVTSQKTAFFNTFQDHSLYMDNESEDMKVSSCGQFGDTILVKGQQGLWKPR